MSHCLVTGAAGFIGTRLVSRLRELGHDVTCLVRHSTQTDELRQLQVRLVVGDVRDPDSLPAAIDGSEVVYHLAGLTRAISARQFAEVNEQGSRNVAQACAASNRPVRLVVVSSLAAGGPSRPGVPRTEADTDQPISQYGRSKLAGEQAVSRLATHVPITIIRPPFVFGPGDHVGLTLFRTIQATGWHVVPGRADLPLSFIHVDDLVRALLLAGARPDRAARHYYVAASASTTYGEMGQLAAQAMDRRVRVLRVRKGWLYLPAIWGELAGRITRRPYVTNLDKLREAQATAWVCSPQRFCQEFDFAADTALIDQLRSTVGWYRAAGWL